MKGEPHRPAPRRAGLAQGRPLHARPHAPPAAHGSSPISFPRRTRVAVGRLKAAGAVLLGKTNTSEFGHKALTENPLFGVTRNPWDPDAARPAARAAAPPRRWRAGSARSALGTDGGGSVRIPAAFCGAVRLQAVLRPRARIARGFRRLGARRARRAAHAHRARRGRSCSTCVAGGDDRDRISLPREPGSYLEACDADVKGLHVAWTPDLGYAAVDPSACWRSCENAAAEFEDARLPRRGRQSRAGRIPRRPSPRSIAAQFYAAWSDRAAGRASRDMDPSLVRFVRRGGAVTARDYLRAVGPRATRTGRRCRRSSSASICC